MSLSLNRLEHLEKMIMDSAQEMLDNETILTRPVFGHIYIEVNQELEKIKALILQEIFEFRKVEEVELFVRCCQIATIGLTDRLYLFFLELTKTGKISPDFIEKIPIHILSIIAFLEERFPKFFDNDEKVPDFYQTMIREELTEMVPRFQVIINDRQTDLIILDQLMKKLKLFGEFDYPLQMTYRDVRFYKGLLSELSQIEMWDKERGKYSGFAKLLIYINFNEREIVNELLNEIDKELNAIKDIIDKIDLLRIYSKEVNQLQLKPDSAFLPGYASVKDQLNIWFTEELLYLEQKFTRIQVPDVIGIRGASEINKKILCNLPVDQIGIFFRAVTDIRLISTPSQKTLFEQIAPILSTAHRTTLSADSLRSKSYSPEKKDIEAVKDFLMKIFRQVATY